MRYTSVYNIKVHYPLWGAVEINKVIPDEDIKFSSDDELFIAMFNDMKSNFFRAGWTYQYGNKIAETYIKSRFGNYALEKVMPSHFQKLDKSSFYKKVKMYINDNFSTEWQYRDEQKDKFQNSIISSIEFATLEAKLFYEFMPSLELKKTLDREPQPFDHFAAFIVINPEGNETDDDAIHQIATSILLFRD